MGNVLSQEKREQVIALGRLGWPLRRIEEATGVRRETAGVYLRKAGVSVRPVGSWGEKSQPKPATWVTTGFLKEIAPEAPEKRTSASASEPYRAWIMQELARGRNAMGIWQDLVDGHGFAGGYQSVKRFVRELRGAASPEAQGFEKLERLGAVHEVPFTERGRAVADLYREMTADPARKILVVAPTHDEIGRVTRAIRDDLSERGLLGQSVTLERHVPLQWTEAQKRDLSNYREGQILLVHRTARGMEKHEVLAVHEVRGNVLVARNVRGEERTFTPAQARSFSVHEQRSIEVAAGDRLLLTGNRRDTNFRATNGELVQVRGVESGHIQLEDGRTIPENYRQFDHGYAVTAHRSQGKTVDSVILSADSMKQELFYVGASRGRSEIAIVTSDREQLRETLGISSARPSAMELARNLAHALEPKPGIQQAVAPKVELPIPDHEIGMGYELGIGL